MNNKQKRDYGGRRLLLFLCILLAAVAACSLVMFFYFNNLSRQTVQAERENYTHEIANQLIRNIDNLQNSYVRHVSEDTELLKVYKPKTMSEMQQMFTDNDMEQHFLVSETGEVMDLSGNICTLSYMYFTSDLKQAGKDVIMIYTTVNFTDDYIIFGSQIEPLSIDGTIYNAFAVGVTSDRFRQNMTVSLFNGTGAGYIIDRNGAIIIKPADNDIVFSGYNFFTALESGGVSKARVEEIRKGIQTGSTSFIVTVDGINWLISCNTTKFRDSFLVVAVPLSLTAANTYRSMSLTVLFAFVFIISLAAILVIILLLSIRRQHEEDKRAAATAAQTNFLAKMSHDIRTPLGAVTGMLDLARDSQRSRAQVDEFVDKAWESANYLLELINGMLDLQKIGKGKMEVAHEPFSIANLLNGIESMYKPVLDGKEIKFLVKGSEQFDTTYIGDMIKVKQILMNLLSNAMKFTPRGGNVALSAERKSLDDKRDEVLFTVSDTGSGMSDEFLKRIFQPFEQEKSSTTSPYVGSGLGLNIVKTLTELMGGTVSVKSEPNIGSSFFVRLPLECGEPVTAFEEVQTNKTIVPFNQERVLLAEDNAINQQIAIIMLQERLNLKVDAVSDGKQALDAMKCSQPGNYAAVILDVRMPVMDGLQAAKAIRALNHPDAKNIPILALSANTYKEDILQSMEAGMNAHLAKPLDIVELSAALHKYIDYRRKIK